MAYYIRLQDCEVELPQELDLDERKAFCDKLIEENLDYFVYTLPKNAKDDNIAGGMVSKRLEIMASYILEASNIDKEYSTLSRFKRSNILKNEINMSDLEGTYSG